MPITVNDNRKYKAMTDADADGLFSQYAQAHLDATAIAAKADYDKSKIQTAADAKIKPLQDRATQLKLELERYINANPERFLSPRKRKHPMGTYGMHSVKGKTEIDADKVIEFALKKRRKELLITTHKPAIEEIKKAVLGGETIPGVVSLPGGEKINIDVKKEAVEAVKRQAAGE